MILGIYKPDGSSPLKAKDRIAITRQHSIAGTISSQISDPAKKKFLFFKKKSSLNLTINSDLLLRELTLIKADLAASLSLEVDVITAS